MMRMLRAVAGRGRAAAPAPVLAAAAIAVLCSLATSRLVHVPGVSAAGSGSTAPTCLALTTMPISVATPLFLTHANDTRLFVIVQAGTITVYQRDGTSLGTFLDVSSLISSGGETGLLGLAFHPNYQSNGLFFINYTDKDGNTVIAKYTVLGDPASSNTANPASAAVVLRVPQPARNHNGGGLWFGPDDGYLYVPLGDGGGGGDTYGNGQDMDTLLGSVLRIDVDTPSPGLNYGIPATNPLDLFGRDEIYAVGMRNPWRCSFGRSANATESMLICGDVGQGSWEEVTVVQAGSNQGWNRLEGHCGTALYFGCHDPAMVFPLADYSHDIGNSVIGGYLIQHDSDVYHASVHGHYLFGDLEGGLLELRPADAAAHPLSTSWSLHYPCTAAGSADVPTYLYSFGTDSDGTLYILGAESGGGGTILRVDAAAVSATTATTCACAELADTRDCSFATTPRDQATLVCSPVVWVVTAIIIVLASIGACVCSSVLVRRYHVSKQAHATVAPEQVDDVAS